MIAIKGMEMPKTCMECPLTYPRWDFNIGCKCCKAIIGHHEEYGEYKTTRHPDCPLVEIVTCKDCRNYVKGALDEEICLKGHELINESFYCKDGERRESNATERK